MFEFKKHFILFLKKKTFSGLKKLFTVFIILIMSLTKPPAENQVRPGKKEGLDELHVKVINHSLISVKYKCILMHWS